MGKIFKSKRNILILFNGIVKIQQDNTENINVVYYDPIA
jgi:hypothetical protein